MQITISPKEEAARGGRLRSRLAQSAIRETLGSSGGPQRKSYVMEPPLRASTLSCHVSYNSSGACNGHLCIAMRLLTVCCRSDGHDLHALIVQNADVHSRCVNNPQATSTLTEELLEGAALNASAAAERATTGGQKKRFSSL